MDLVPFQSILIRTGSRLVSSHYPTAEKTKTTLPHHWGHDPSVNNPDSSLLKLAEVEYSFYHMNHYVQIEFQTHSSFHSFL